jgi:hypothetical protein
VRVHLARPTVYIGERGASSANPLPLDVGHAGAAIRHARHHEQQVG